jgi:4-nitrophenyl phosphatase
VRIPIPSRDELLARYDLFLLDAYGVLVNGAGPLPGAAGFLRTLQAAGRPFALLTNDASRLPERLAERYQAWGLPIDAAVVVTSGGLLDGWVTEEGLRGGRAMVLGPEDSCEYARRAGLEPVPLCAEVDPDLVMIGDEEGYEFLTGVDAAITAIVRGLERGTPPRLVAPNPDILHPKGDGTLGISSGAVAALIETAVALRAATKPLRFERLGKPRAALFQAGLRLFPEAGSPLMVGDQAETDLRGARALGIDSLLVGTGVSRLRDLSAETRPTWYLPRGLA